MKRSIGIAVLVLSSFIVFAQNEQDALNYSYISPIGTARFSAMGGAFGALGGDFTSININPGGIGIYRKSEFTITPSIMGSKTNATYNGTSTEDNKLNFNFGNIGLVATWQAREGKTHGWLNGNFGVGYTRTNSFHERQLVEGPNATGTSAADVWASQLNGIHYDSVYNYAQYGFDALLAWETYLVDTLPGSVDQYGTAVGGSGTTQRLEGVVRGSMGETAISFGGNYGNRLYIGASIGFPNIRYSSNSTYTETSTGGDTASNFTSFEYNYNLTTKGSGYNFKVGAIYRAADWLRLGGAIHTPTFFQLTDTWDSDMTTEAYGSVFRAASPQGLFDYELTTPFRAIGSLGLVFGTQGMISMDYEHVDYSTARLSAPNESYSFENQQIKNSFKSVGNVRVGAEWRYQAFSFREGYAMGNPTKGGITTDRPVYSAGIGYREKNFFVDFAYVLKTADAETYLYDPAISNPAQLKYSEGTGLLTFGFRY